MAIFHGCLFAFIVFLRGSSANNKEWTAELPKSVEGLSGSCVVIPCKFKFPEEGKKHTEFTGIWYKGTSEVIHHTKTSEIIPKFKDRTSLLGDLHHNNCTLKISSLSNDDGGSYKFRIEIKDFEKFTYGHFSVSLTVKDSQEPPTVSVKEDLTSKTPVTATCVTSHSCPSDPPRVTWSRGGTETSQTQPQEDGQWRLTSSLTFTPSREDHNEALSCSVQFGGGKKVSSYKTLNVKYPPYNVTVVSKSPVKENGSVELTCSTDSNPPANSFQWFSFNKTLLASGLTYRLNHVSRHIEAIFCTAVNTEGKNSSSPHKMNVLYPPYNVTVVSKSPVKENGSVELTCSSDSNPPANSFQWFSFNKTLLASGLNYRLNHVSRHIEAISCTAVNTEGKTSSSPYKINVLYPPEIKNESACKSETLAVCLCIVDSNPPSEVKWLGPSSAFPSSSVEQNGSITIFTLNGWLGFPNTVHCSASNSEGNSVRTFQVTHGSVMYIAFATPAVIITLVVISVCVAKRYRGRRAEHQPHQKEMKTTSKSCTTRKEMKNDHLYTNYKNDQRADYQKYGAEATSEQGEDEAVYANM